MAMNREKECHQKNRTFGEVCSAPNTVKPIPADWIFKIKHRGELESIDTLLEQQYKARIILRGQFMKPGLDFNDAFSPVAKNTTIRAVLAVATKYDMELYSGDVETAFLTPEIDTEIWVSMPPFYGKDASKIDGQAGRVREVRRLLKGVPGIPQGGKLFFDKFSGVLLQCGFRQSAADKCLFLKHKNGKPQLCTIWVDDFIFACHDCCYWNELLAQLKPHFNITGGALQQFLGLEIVRERSKRQMSISQSSVARGLLDKFGMSDANSVPVPSPAGFIFTKLDSPQPDEKLKLEESGKGATQFRQRSALINFLSCWTRPDVTFCVNKLSKFMSNPGATHWAGLNHLIKYFKGSADKGLVYDFENAPEGVDGLHGYTDASYADCPDSSRSTLGYAFFYGRAPISWYSKLHSFVTTSTNHSEYAALALGAKEAKWLAELFDDIDPQPIKAHRPVPIFGDSSGVIALVFNPVDHQSNKHIRVADHYARELTKEGVIAPHRVASELNRADMFTKPLQGTVFKKAAALFVDVKLEQKTEAVFMFRATFANEHMGTVKFAATPIVMCQHCRILSSRERSNVVCIVCEHFFFHWLLTACTQDQHHLAGLLLCVRDAICSPTMKKFVLNAWLVERMISCGFQMLTLM